jgi:hypothetical protein
MPIYLNDLIENREILKERREYEQKCFRCNVVLQETLTGKRSTPDGDACSDCFYEQMGEEIESYPIASAGIRRV